MSFQEWVMNAEHDSSDVLMWKEKEILEIYPYQTIGAIISLIGSVTAIIGHYIPEVNRLQMNNLTNVKNKVDLTHN